MEWVLFPNTINACVGGSSLIWLIPRGQGGGSGGRERETGRGRKRGRGWEGGGETKGEGTTKKRGRREIDKEG